MSKLNVYFKLSEADSFWAPTVQPEIADAIQKSVDFLKSEYSCTIQNHSTFSELNQSYEIAGTCLFSLQDLPNLLKSVGFPKNK